MHYTAKYWEYDPVYGRRWNLDPVDQLSVSNYAVFLDNPILYIDPDGDYSRFGAWWRNARDGGRGIEKNERTGEWGYEVEEETGISYRDGRMERLKREWLRAERRHQTLSNVYKMSTGGGNLDADRAAGVVSDEPMDSKDRINAAFNLASLAFIGLTPQSVTIATAAKGTNVYKHSYKYADRV